MKIRLSALVGLLGVTLVAAPNVVRADTITGDIYDNTLYEQTSNSAPTTASYFFNIGVSFSTAGDFTSGSATYPGSGSPQALSPQGSTELGFETSPYPTLAALHADYPFGNYTITATGPAGTQTSVISYTADYFETSNTPYVTDYSSLSGLNPNAGFTVDYLPFTPNANTTPTDQFTFFTIYDQTTGAVVFSDAFQSPSSTDAFIPAGTLAADTTYDYELDYSNRLDGFDTQDSTFTQQGFDVRTDGSFTTGAAATAVPEPSSLPMLLAGLAAIGGMFYFGRKKAATA